MKRLTKSSATPTTLFNQITLRGRRPVWCVALAVVAFASLRFFIGGSASDTSTHGVAASSKSAPHTVAQARDAYGQLPLSFEANRGQAGEAVNFLARGAGYTLALSPKEAVFALVHRADKRSLSGESSTSRRDDSGAAIRGERGADASNAPRSEPPTVLRMSLVGASEGARVEGLNELEGKVNYLIGNDPAQWRTNIPTFGRVRYAEVYPGIDVVYYGNQKQLEYDFVVAPGRDALAIKLRFEGADKVEVNAAGDLLLTLGESTMRQPKPMLYQEVAGGRRAVDGGYVVGPDGRVGFTVGEYDAQQTLVIDPVLSYSTYLGGSDVDEGNDIAVDSAGNAYICGITNSTNFPTANAIQGTFNPPIDPTLVSRDGFVTKLNAAGTALVYSTYLGGDRDDRCNKIAVDASGNAYVAGETGSSNFPTANAFQGTYGGGLSDGYIAKLNAAGTAFVYSTYLGGDVFDAAHALTIDSAGSVYVTGRTTSANFPTVNPIQGTYSGGPGADAFVTKFNAAGSAIVYSTYLGGNAGNGGGFTAGFSIAVDSAGSAYVTGQTRATNFPTANAIQATFGGGSPDGDAFVTKLNAAGTALVYSTYLGGSDNDIGFEIALDSSNNAYVTGVVRSGNFPVANALQSALSGTSDAFVTKLNAAGSAFVYSTYLGGTSDDSGNGIAVGSSGNAYVTGGTSSTNFPLLNPTQGASGGGVDAFVTRLNTAGSALVFSTYLGGSGTDAALDIALDSVGSMYITGRTSSTNLPTASPVQSTNGGGATDVFVSKLSETPPTPTIGLSQSSYSVGEAGVFVSINVVRAGDISQPATVSYTTSDTSGLNECSTVTGIASSRCDYSFTVGRLSFAAGEQSKTVTVSIVDDSYAEGAESFTFALSNPTGAGLSATATATVTITDNEAANGANPIDGVDFFIRQHYLDFLSREPEPGGFAGWKNVLNNCGTSVPQPCDRIEVSSGFFRSEEFQVRGYFIYRFYTVLGRIPLFTEFMTDFAKVSGFLTAQQLEANKAAFVTEFMARSEFQTKYGSLTDPTAYVDALLQTVGLPNHPSRSAWITGLTNATMTRGQVLRALIESQELYLKYYSEAFVVMQYFGYLRRNPDSMYLQWIQTLNQTGDYRTMINGFLNSTEYRKRFGP